MTWFHDGPEVPIFPDTATEPFWSAAEARRLVVARCASCGRHRMPPSRYCPSCRSLDVEWVESAGAGTVYSYTVVHRPVRPDQRDAVPYAVALVALADVPVKLLGGIAAGPGDWLRIGAPVELVWQRFDHYAAPRFRPATPATPSVGEDERGR